MGRRTHGQGSLIKLSNSPFWHARFYDASGRKISISTKCTTKMEAEDFLRKQMDDVRNKGLAPLSDLRKITYGDLRAGLLADYEARGNKSLLTRADGTDTIMGLPQLDEFFGFDESNPGPSIVNITTDTGRAFVEKRRGEGVGAAVINRSLACLRRMLKIAHQDGKIVAVPFIRLLKEPSARKGFLPLEKFKELLGHMPTHLKPLVLFLYYCGCRIGESLAIEWPQVDLDTRLIRLEPEQTKGDEARTVPLPSQLVMMLREIEPKVGKVFSDTNLRKSWMTACDACGLGRKIEQPEKPYDPKYEGLTIHDLRRSAVRNLVTVAGVPERVAMSISGHKTRAVFDRYHIVSTTDVTGAMQRVELAAENLLSQKNGYRLGKQRAKTLKVKTAKGRRKNKMALSSRG
jgi:integrase